MTADKSRNKSEDDKNDFQKPVRIADMVITSPDNVKIIGCGDMAIELLNGIFSNYPEKLKGLKHQVFNKPTKPDYLDLRLKPDYRNIRAANIKKELRESLEQDTNTTLDSKSSTEVTGTETQEQEEEDNNQEVIQPEGVAGDGSVSDTSKRGAKLTVLNKLFKRFGARQKTGRSQNDYDEKDGSDIKTSETEYGTTVDKQGYNRHGQDQRDQIVIEARAELEKELTVFFENTDLLFTITDLKSNFGLDNSLIASKIARKNDIISVGLVVLPPSLEKLEEVENGNRILQSYRLNADIVVVIPAVEHIIEGYLVVIITELLELMTTSGLVNLDIADIKTVVGGGNVAMLGFGSGRARDQNKIMEAVNEAVSSPILNIDLNGVTRTLVNVSGDSAMTISEAEKSAKEILEKIQPDARLIWGAAINPKLKGAIKVMVMVGIQPKNILMHIYANS